MRACWVIALALGVSIGAQAGLTAEAAKKYYPPGFTPPADQPAVEAKPPETSAPPVVVPGGKQVIIKTVAKPAPPRDPLLVLLDEHRYYDALRLIESRLKANPGNASLQLMRGQVLRLDGNFEEALEQYQSVLDKHKNKSVRAGTWNGLGWTYYRKALYERQSGSEPVAKASLDSAEHAFRQVFSLEPRMAYAWAGLGQVQLAQGKMTEAEGAIKRALQYGGSGNTTAQLARAELLLAQKKPEEALQMLYGLKKTVTREPQVFLLLAHASLETGKVDDAIINLKQLLALMPEHTDALRLLSHSYERKMKHQDAEQALEKAIAINPGDEKSVELLLKIYDQRNEQERAILLLRRLLKDRPGQTAYAAALLSRLERAGRWEEAYQEGRKFVGQSLANPNGQDEHKRAVMVLFSRVLHQQARGMVNPQQLLDEPVARQARQYAAQRYDDVRLAGEKGFYERLSLLMLDPLAKLPANQAEPGPDELSPAMQAAFLEGDKAVYARLMPQARASARRLEIARQLFELGDFAGAEALIAEALVQEPSSPDALALQQEVAQFRRLIQEQLAALTMLPRRIADSHWQKASSDVLKLGGGDWKTHATMADVLEKRRQADLALIHQRLAAQYAPSEKERERWTKKAEKTARSLNRAR